MDPDKAELRLVLRARRAAEPTAAARARADRLAAASAEFQPHAGRAVAAYQPTNHEPDVTALVVALDRPVYVPRVAGRDLEWVAVPAVDLAGPRTGIPCPPGPAAAPGPAVAVLGVGVMLVPALAVDPRTGTRLGYGRGYYDRMLGAMTATDRDRVLVVGVCREEELVDLPPEPHDQPMDAVLTEAGLVRIAPVEPGAPPAGTA